MRDKLTRDELLLAIGAAKKKPDATPTDSSSFIYPLQDNKSPPKPSALSWTEKNSKPSAATEGNICCAATSTIQMQNTI